MTTTMNKKAEHTTSQNASLSCTGLNELHATGEPTRDLEYYCGLHYPVELLQDEESFVVSHPDLPGCISFGDSPNDALDNLKQVTSLWIQGQLRSGQNIPEPSTPDRYSGKFVLRIPKMLHRLLEYHANREGVSLNTYVTSLLSGALSYSPKNSTVSMTVKHERLRHWCDAGSGWELTRIGTTFEVHNSSKESEAFVRRLAKSIGNSSSSLIKSEEFTKEHRHA